MPLKGAEGFEMYYKDIYGARWEKLRQSLLSEHTYMQPDDNRLQKPYHMDPGSVWAARQLPLLNAEQILDACAAPGGKSLVLALGMSKTAQLFLNDRSPDRVKRLKQVIDMCLEPQIKSRIQIKNSNILHHHIWKETSFEAILLDAPCSSERHLLAHPKYMGQWSPTRGKRLAEQQLLFLKSLSRNLKVGGHLLYCTCSINPLENEAPIQRWSQKHPQMQNIALQGPFGAETSNWGTLVLPDLCDSQGPIFASLWTRAY